MVHLALCRPTAFSLDLEVRCAITWHQPYNDGRSDKDEAYAGKNITPLEVVFDIETAHFPIFYAFMDAKIQKTLNFHPTTLNFFVSLQPNY